MSDDEAGPESELGAAVDEALADEVRRRKARFISQIVGIDRAEGVGRGEEHWNESLRLDARGDTPDEPTD